MKNQIIMFLMLFMIVIMTLSPVIATNSTEPQWPKQGYDNKNTGQSPYLGPQNNTTQWNYTMNGNETRIGGDLAIGSDGTIYFGSDLISEDDFETNVSGVFYALYSNGTQKWDKTLNETNISISYHSPVVSSDGTIYFGSTNFIDEETSYGKLYALNPDGTLKWNYTPMDNWGNKLGITFYAPTVDSDGTIYFGSSYIENNVNYGDLFALNPDGTLKWKFTPKYDQYVKIGAPVIGSDGTIYFGNSFGEYGYHQTRIYALNHDGSLKWDRSLLNDGDNVAMSGFPVIGSDGTLYLGTTENKGRIMANLFALNPDGTLKWNKTLNDGNKSYIYIYI